MDIAQEPIFIWMSQYAYEPILVYCSIILIMLASSFGFPVPEEVTLISAGLLVYMGKHPELFPPPSPDAPTLNVYVTATVCLASIFLSDLLVFYIGRRWGRRLIKTPRFQKIIKPSVMEKIESWIAKYGVWVCGMFRFTPGIRFPGHLSCGMFGFSIAKFTMVDGAAALISVPTQVFLIASFGETILANLQKAKLVIMGLLAAFVLYTLAKKIYQWRQRRVSGQLKHTQEN